ncbi:DNA-binding transcriptional ArsR family regulator [Kibdelosporangium banguiense]|uniref:DNA-binding transcriptional ArsR family regulator n=1 Tax=Kibdelosporangium banguiense TaxID=1365924 RepID=A0ABS4TAT7_9PSEU|nr:winged helix-turn-helix domain-containing protein [Kibdelosporangium banguiense]MBP2321535.1 DNA-binding transcriptional ArsR family regulator [Kibdelosporangium banguiense]
MAEHLGVDSVLRIHFTTADLVRTRVAAAADPFWEMVFSRRRLFEQDAPLVLRPWAERMQADAAVLRPGIGALGALSPAGPYFPDFLTPSEGVDGFDAGMEALLSTPRKRLDAEIARMAVHSQVPAWVRRVADGEPEMLASLEKALRSYHDTAIKPLETQVQSRVDADRARRGRDLLDGGTDQLLAGFGPMIRWHAPVLQMPYPVDRDLYLEGRGLRLVPSFFCRWQPVALADPRLPPTLVYPIDHESHWEITGDKSLADLLGNTRATVLHSIDGGATTTELARRVATSLASVSRHTTVLREAGLIETHRRGAAVLHTLTPLGESLLSNARRARPRPSLLTA